MALLFDSEFGDFVIDLNHQDPALTLQVQNLTGLVQVNYFAKLDCFTGPKLHFEYPVDSFLFLGDPTYTGKGGQSMFNFLHQFDPSNALSSRFSTFKSELSSTVDLTASYYSLQQQDKLKRREYIQSLLSDMGPAGGVMGDRIDIDTSLVHDRPGPSHLATPPHRQILFLSIPHSSGGVSSLFAFYLVPQQQISSPFQQHHEQHHHEEQSHHHHQQQQQRPPHFPEALYDYVIGIVSEGSDVVQKLFQSATENKHTISSSLPTTTTTTTTTATTTTTRGGSILQCGIVFSPLQPITTVPSQNFIFPHHFRKSPSLLNQPRSQLKSHHNDNSDDDELYSITSLENTTLFLDRFVYNPRAQHSPPPGYHNYNISDGSIGIFQGGENQQQDQPQRPPSLPHKDEDEEDILIQVAMGDGQKNMLFISNLNPSTTEAQLRAYFGQYGPVLHCNLIKEQLGASTGPMATLPAQTSPSPVWKCYAFVAMNTDQLCEMVVQTCHKTVLDNYTINVDYCHSNHASASGMTGHSKYYKVHLATPFFSRPKRATLASAIIAGANHHHQ